MKKVGHQMAVNLPYKFFWVCISLAFLALLVIFVAVQFEEYPTTESLTGSVASIDEATRRRVYKAIAKCDGDALQAATNRNPGPIDPPVDADRYHEFREGCHKGVQKREGISDDDYWLIAGEGLNEDWPEQ